jgi:hypothetical protein
MRVLILAAALAVSTVPATAAFAAGAKYTTATTTIEALVADPASKAVLDKMIPGLSGSAQLDQIKGSTLKQLQGMAPDQVPDKLLADIDAELAKIPTK